MAGIWRAIFATDRLLRRVPSLIQVWFVEFWLIVPLMCFIGKWVDIHGTSQYPGTGDHIENTHSCGLLISLICGFFFFRSLFFPRIHQVTWTPPAETGFPGGAAEIGNSQPRATVEYPFLSSHPSYSLLLLLTTWLPLTMILMTQHQGGNTLYWRASGYAGLIIIAVMAVLRFVCWYGFGFGRSAIQNASHETGLTTSKISWELAWKPTLVLVFLMHAIAWIPMGIMMLGSSIELARLPLITVELANDAPPPHQFGSDTPRRWYRIEGRILGEPVFWPTLGENRGGDNYRGAGIRIALASGGEALILAESLSVPDLIEDLAKARRNGIFRSTGYLVSCFSSDQTKYYGFQLDDFPAPEPGARVLMIHGYP